MHLPEEHRQESEKRHLHVVLAGHLASDTLGINLLLDAIETEAHFTILACSGFKRIMRQP